MSAVPARVLHSDHSEDLVGTFLSQPGVPHKLAGELLGTGPWIAAMAEHHLATQTLGVDVMACAHSPWDSAPHCTSEIPQELDTLGAPLFWLEWDVAAGRPLDRPLWSICTEVQLLTDRCIGRAPYPSEALRRRAGDCLLGEDDARCLERVAVALGALGRVLHIAPLSVRGGTGHRISFVVRHDGVVRWLRAIGHEAIPEDLSALLFDIATLQQGVGVQIEIRNGRVGAYLGIESPVVWQGRRMHLDRLWRWLPMSPHAIQRVADVMTWILTGDSTLRRHGYFKFVWKNQAFEGKIYAGVTASPPVSPQ